jgi:hypothetical protein
VLLIVFVLVVAVLLVAQLTGAGGDHTPGRHVGAVVASV